MDAKKTDRRILKTQKAIRRAFAELLEKKNIDDITITNIAAAADINRKTFYHYYSGIYALIDEIENEIVTAFDTALREIDPIKDLQDPYIIFSKLTAVINSHIDFYGPLLRADRSGKLLTKIKTLLKRKTKEALRDRFGRTDAALDVVVDYTISGMVATYQSWFNSGRQQSIEEISRLISLLFTRGIRGVIDGK